MKTVPKLWQYHEQKWLLFWGEPVPVYDFLSMNRLGSMFVVSNYLTHTYSHWDMNTGFSPWKKNNDIHFGFT